MWPSLFSGCVLAAFFVSSSLLSFPPWARLDLGLDSLLHTFHFTCKAIINNPQLLIMRWQRRAINQQPANEFPQILCVVEMERAPLFFLQDSVCISIYCAQPHTEYGREWMSDNRTETERWFVSEIRQWMRSMDTGSYSPWNRAH